MARLFYRALAGGDEDERDENFRRIASSYGDAGKTRVARCSNGRTSPEPFGLIDSYESFEQLHKLQAAPSRKRCTAKSFGASYCPRRSKYVVKILSGDLRIGLREGLVEEAIAKAFAAPLDEVKEANMPSATSAAPRCWRKRQELHRAELTPLPADQMHVASPEPTAEAIWKRFVESNVVAAVARSRVGSRAGISDAGYSLCRRQVRWNSCATT